jgi:hypothetical protein
MPDPRDNRFPPASTLEQWCLIHFQEFRCACTALLVEKTTGGTALWSGSLKGPTELNCIHKGHSHSGGEAQASIFPIDFRTGFLSFGCRFFRRGPTKYLSHR